MTTHPTEADFAQATEAHHPETGQIATRDRKLPGGGIPIYFPWRSADPFPDGTFYTGDLYLADWGFIPGPAPVASPTVPEWGDIPADERGGMVERLHTALSQSPGWAVGALYDEWTTLERALAAALTSPSTRPEWADLEDVLKAGWPDGVNGAQNSHIARALHEAGVRVPEVGQ